MVNFLKLRYALDTQLNFLTGKITTTQRLDVRFKVKHDLAHSGSFGVIMVRYGSLWFNMAHSI